MRITRVKRTRKTIFVAWTVGDEEFDLTSRDNPLPAFIKALDALPPLVCEICHLPKTYAEGLQVNGAYITEVGQVDAVTIVAVKTLPDNNRPLNLATPLRLLDNPEEPAAANPPLSDRQIGLINDLLDEAKRYVKCQRAQGQIDFGPELPAEEVDKKQLSLALRGGH